jgi:CBS domain-containing protein
MQIRALMSQYIEVIHPDASLTEAAQKMRQVDVGLLPVCEGERLVGILTDRDITVRAVAQGCDPRTTRVRDVMTPEVVSCCEDQDVQTAAQLMATRQLRRLPVLDHAQRLVGILSLADLAVYATDEQLASAVLEEVSEPAILSKK